MMIQATRCLYTISILLVLAGVVFVMPAQAGWDFIKDIFSDESSDPSGITAGLSSSDMIAGLKEALSVSGKKAIDSLGKTDGFFANPKVKIPMPQQLQSVESALRKLKQDKMADEFVLTMNRAAERAVPETSDILVDAIKQMTIDDAKAIVNGPNNAATEYFRKTSSGPMAEKILPIVQSATAKVGVTRRYKGLIDQLGVMKGLIDVDSLDLDQYITDKTVAGLFTRLAEEEVLIRTDPAARTTELLKKVFAK